MRRRQIPEIPNALEVAFDTLRAESSQDAERRALFEVWVDKRICPAVNGIFNRIKANKQWSMRKDLVFIKPPRHPDYKYTNQVSVGHAFFLPGVKVSYMGGLTEALQQRFAPNGYTVELNTPKNPDDWTTLITMPNIKPYIDEVERFDITKLPDLPEL